ncbi:FIP1[III]-like protein [Nymphaea thermarum]|nr:FIP1[III]-like protein [Nymphaea thermarum]
MEEMDDFGDLYADVGIEVNPASTVSNVCQKAVEDDFVPGVSSHCNGDERELNEESILYGRIRGVDGFGGSRTVEEVMKPLHAEGDRNRSGESGEYEEGNARCGGNIAAEQTAAAEREVGGLTDCDVGNALNRKSEKAEASSSSQYSDSEDDLHIVLNEDDGCHSQLTSMFRSSRPSGMASDDDDEDDDLVIVMGEETPDKDQKWAEEAQSPQGVNDGGTERHRSTKNGGSCGSSRQYQNSQYSQYKYVRQRATGIVNRHRAPQVQVGHGDTKIASCNSGSVVPLVSENAGTLSFDPSGREFFLPRNKTIFDVGIDLLDMKPWRCPGVDITDFFNFGMDEESWKNYCMSLAQYREQATMRMRIPVYESVPGSGGSEAFRGEFNTLNKEERICSAIVATERNARWTEIRKGRTIQVEDGAGERLPSVDVRRPRVRDSDVVIQVMLQEEVRASEDTHKENVRYSNGSVQNKSPGKEAYVMESELLDSHNDGELNPASSIPEFHKDTRHRSIPSVPACGRSQCSTFSSKKSGISLLERYSGHDSAHSDDHSDEQSKSHPSGNNRKRDAPKGTMENDERKGDISSKSEHSPSQNESAFSDQTSDGSRHGHVERHSRSESGSFIDAEKISSSGEQHYISPPHQLDERPNSSQDHHCIEFKNRRSKVESVRSRGRLKFHQEDKMKCDGRSMRRSMARSKKPMGDGVSFSRDKSKHDVAIHSETMEGKVNLHIPHEKRSLVYYEETEESTKHRRKLLERRRRDNAYSEDIYNKNDLRRSLDVGAERNVAIRGYISGENVVGGSRKKHQEAWLVERGTQISRGRGLFPDEECGGSDLEHLSRDNKRQRYKYLKYEGETRTSTDLHNMISRKSHKQEVMREWSKGCMPYSDRGIEIKGVKERYGHDMRSDMHKLLRDWEIDEVTWMHPGKRDLFLSDPKQSSTVRSKIISEHTSAEDTQHIREQKEKIRDCYSQADSRDLRYKKHQYEGLLIHRMKEHYHSSKLDNLAAANDWDDNREDSGFSCGSFFSENGRNGWLSEDIYNTNDEASSGYWHQDNGRDLCSYYSHEDAIFEHKDVKRHGLDRGNVLGFGGPLSDKGRLWESDVDLQIHSFSDVGGEGKNYGTTPLSCRESVKSQRNVWEEKFFRRYSRMGNLRRDSADKQRRAFRKFDELYADNEVSFSNSRAEAKAFCSVNSEIGKRLLYDTNNSYCRHKSMCLDKHLVKHHRGAEVSVSKEDPTLEYSKKEVKAVEKIQEVRKEDTSAHVDENDSGDKVLRKLHHEKGTDNQSAPEEDNKRILEMLAKMEKRRERFKESVSLKKESNGNLHHVLDVVTENQESETRETKQRPMRKRRWCGS